MIPPLLVAHDEIAQAGPSPSSGPGGQSPSPVKSADQNVEKIAQNRFWPSPRPADENMWTLSILGWTSEIGDGVFAMDGEKRSGHAKSQSPRVGRRALALAAAQAAAVGASVVRNLLREKRETSRETRENRR